MKKQDLTTISLKLLGVYTVMQAFQFIPAFGFLLAGGWSEEKVKSLLLFIFSISILLVLAYLLIAKADSLANRLVQPDHAELPTQPISLSEIQSISFSAIGVFAVVSSTPKLIRCLMRLIFVKNSDHYETVSSFFQMEGPDLFSFAVQTGLGLWLFYRGRSLALFWQFLQRQKPMAR